MLVFAELVAPEYLGGDPREVDAELGVVLFSGVKSSGWWMNGWVGEDELNGEMRMMGVLCRYICYK